jgi:hypothetical protein
MTNKEPEETYISEMFQPPPYSNNKIIIRLIVEKYY